MRAMAPMGAVQPERDKNMSYLDEEKKELEKILPPLTRKDDFDAFWAGTIAQTKAVPLAPSRRLARTPLGQARVYDISYRGFDETPIHGWLIVPTLPEREKFPCLIHYHGFNLNRGFPWDFAHWILAGAAVLSVDCRDQSGETGNAAGYTGGQVKNILSRGLLDKDEYYGRALYMDALKAIDFAQSCPEIDAEHIALEGASQGGGLVMAVAGLDSRPDFGMADVPSNSYFEKRVEAGCGAFSSVQEYLRIYPDRLERVFDTLSYFDTMNLADRIRCPIYASVGLHDSVSPARLYFASYNRIQSEKRIELYPFNNHEGGGSLHTGRKLEYLRQRWNLG
jgi:cephalosporin-C deacetylase